jgi:hypothetical protein
MILFIAFLSLVKLSGQEHLSFCISFQHLLNVFAGSLWLAGRAQSWVGSEVCPHNVPSNLLEGLAAWTFFHGAHIQAARHFRFPRNAVFKMKQAWVEAEATITNTAGSMLLFSRTDRWDNWVEPERMRKLQSERAGDDSREILT